MCLAIASHLTTVTDPDGKRGVGGGAIHRLKVRKWSEAGDFRASERAGGLSLLVSSLSLFRGRRGSTCGWGRGWGMECHRQGCIDFVEEGSI